MPELAAEKITLLHYNDVYNVESREVEPVGGAARFVTAVKELQELNPLILFSGDIFAPSISMKQVSIQIKVDFPFSSEHLHQGRPDGSCPEQDWNSLCCVWKP